MMETMVFSTGPLLDLLREVIEYDIRSSRDDATTVAGRWKQRALDFADKSPEVPVPDAPRGATMPVHLDPAFEEQMRHARRNEVEMWFHMWFGLPRAASDQPGAQPSH